MASYDICEMETPPVPRFKGPLALLSPLLRVWNALLERMDERRTIQGLYRLDEHLLRDMGFDPGAIYAAREGAIGEWKSRRCGEA